MMAGKLLEGFDHSKISSYSSSRPICKWLKEQKKIFNTKTQKKSSKEQKKNYEKMQIDVKAQKSKKNVTQVDDVN